MANTYGFGGSEPTVNVNQGGYGPSKPAGGGINTTTGSDDKESQGEGTLREHMWDETQRGSATVNGLDTPGVPRFSAAFTGAEVDYTKNMVGIGAGTANTLGASWPIDYDDPAVNYGVGDPGTGRLADRGAMHDVYGNDVGAYTTGIIP